MTKAVTPENEFEELLIHVLEDEGRLHEFMSSLPAHDLFIPQVGSPRGDETDEPLPEGAERELPLIEDEGRAYVPAFSSLTQLSHAVPGETAYLCMRGDALMSMCGSEYGLAINPGGQFGIALEPEHLSVLEIGQGPSTVRLASGSEVFVGEPEEEPSELLESIAAACNASADVQAGYRAVLVHDADQQTELVIGLKLADRDAVEEVIPRLTTEINVSPMPVSFIVIDSDEPDAVSLFMLEETQPFYRRDS